MIVGFVEVFELGSVDSVGDVAEDFEVVFAVDSEVVFVAAVD